MQALKLCKLWCVCSRPPSQVEHLPGEKFLVPGASREQGHGSGGSLGQRCETLEGESEQSITDEDGGGLVVLDVKRRLTTALIVIIHRRKIVVHETVGVQELDRDGCRQAAIALRAASLTRL